MHLGGILVNANRTRRYVVLLLDTAVTFDRVHEVRAPPLVPANYVGHAVVLGAVLHEGIHARRIVVRVRGTDNLCSRIQFANQVVGLFPEHRIEVAVLVFPGTVRFVPDFVTVKVLVVRFELVVDDRGNLVFPVVHVLELVRPAR